MLRLLAPAKLNLFLHITGRRTDGLHNLETIFQLLDYGDELSFKLDPMGDISLDSNISGVKAEDNLVVRAAKALQSESGSAVGAQIQLKKIMPQGGGIGGGSSDAATTLLALNQLWDLNFPPNRLAKIGLQLGADVPVFVRGHSAFAKGVGEELTPLQIPEKWYLVITPQVLVSTGKIFSHPELTRDTPAIKIPPLAVEGGQNDCQSVVENLYPEIRETREWMEQFAAAFMTGTGASLFSVFENEAEAQAVFRQVPDTWNAFVAKGVNRSPVLSQLENFSQQ